MQVIIADDERPARDELGYLLRKIEGVEIVAEASNGEETMAKVRELRPDALFLDIQMPDASGVEIARQIIKEGINLDIVFATAYDQYAVAAFDVNAVDYLLKPFQEERIEKTIARLNSNKSIGSQDGFIAKIDKIYASLQAAEHKEKFKIEDNGKILLIPVEDILYATIEERSVRVVTSSGKSYLANYTLNELQGLLGVSFLRVHKSYLANLDHVQTIIPWFNNTYNIVMSDKSEIPVSRTYVKNFREYMGL